MQTTMAADGVVHSCRRCGLVITVAPPPQKNN
jgi:hypothetical protein